MKYSPTKWYGLPMGPRDTCFEMQIGTYAHCPSRARQPIDRLKQILLIIEYLMAIIKSLTEVLTPHFQFSSSYSGDRPLTRRHSPCCTQRRAVQLIAIKLGIELMSGKERGFWSILMYWTAGKAAPSLKVSSENNSVWFLSVVIVENCHFSR